MMMLATLKLKMRSSSSSLFRCIYTIPLSSSSPCCLSYRPAATAAIRRIGLRARGGDFASPSKFVPMRMFTNSRSCSSSVRASNVSDPSSSGSISTSMMQSMENKIKEQLKADTVIVKDAYGDGRHVSIYVVSSEFEGQSAVNRQRMVYKAIWEELQSTVHAVDQMTTRTPEEAVKDQ